MPRKRFALYVAALLIAVAPAVASHPAAAAAPARQAPARHTLTSTSAPHRALGVTTFGLRREVFGFALASSLADSSFGDPTWDFRLLSTVAFFGLHVNWDGTILSDSDASVWNSSALAGLVQTAHANGAIAVVTIVLQDFSPGTPNMCAALINRTVTVSQTVAQLQAKHVDGVNVDYEGLNGTCQNGQTSRDMMVDFLRQLRGALPYASLSVDTYAGSAIDSLGFFDVAGLAQYVDSEFVMAYDLEYSNWRWPPLGCASFCLSPTAPRGGYYYNDASTIAQYVAVVPASKVILGVPYYGRKACVSSPSANAWVLSGSVVADTYLDAVGESTASGVQAGSFATHRDANDATGNERWDTWYNSTLGCTRELYWDDATSLGAKYDLVNSTGIRGVGIWNLNYGGGAPELWQALRSRFAGCASVSQSASPASPVLGGTVVTVTATAQCPGSNPQYAFWIEAPGASAYTLQQQYSTNPVLTWSTANLPSGTYRINVWVKDGAGIGGFSNSSGNWDAYNANLYITITSKPCSAVSQSTWPQGAAMIGVAVTLTGAATSCPNPLYEFWLLAPGASLYTLAQGYSSAATLIWPTSGKTAGTYRVDVWVKDASSYGLQGNASGRWDAYDASVYYTLTPGCPSVGESASPAGGAQAGAPVNFTASTTGCPNPLYEFWVLAPGATSYTLAQAYSTTPTLAWPTSTLASGTYRINVWVRDASSTGVYANSSGRWDAYNASLYYTINPTCSAVSETASATTVVHGTTVTVTAGARGCVSPLYEFWVLAPGATLYTLVQAYSSSPVLSLSTASSGTYRINVWVRDAGSNGVSGNAYGRWDTYDAGLYLNVT
ncbi:MAG TPA: glycosyl hydrolase family 18 protein [Candidatus Dormibacteraeota bacterium]|nr:glycosyl hydrolase family 18 protein [Candidatus Dormibacteraeota bacterium]